MFYSSKDKDLYSIFCLFLTIFKAMLKVKISQWIARIIPTIFLRHVCQMYNLNQPWKVEIITFILSNLEMRLWDIKPFQLSTDIFSQFYNSQLCLPSPFLRLKYGTAQSIHWLMSTRSSHWVRYWVGKTEDMIHFFSPHFTWPLIFYTFHDCLLI